MTETTEEFYRAVATSYDAMTRFAQRLQSEAEVLRGWQERFRFRTALDAACGTGIHAILLAEAGVDTTAADISPEMLARAKQNAAARNVSVHWVESPMQKLSRHIRRRFDAVLCLGNSLPHLLSPADLRDALGAFYRLLGPGGHLILQLLNYHKILASGNRLIGVHRQGATEFIRFYDFLEETIHFNILQIDWESAPPKTRLNSTELYPYRWEDLQPALLKAGFIHFERYGNMKFAEFDPEQSPNLIIVASAN